MASSKHLHAEAEDMLGTSPGATKSPPDIETPGRATFRNYHETEAWIV